MHTFTNNNGSCLVAILIIGLIISFAGMTTMVSSSFSTRKISQRRCSVSAFNIAEAGKEHALAQIRSGTIDLVPNTLTQVFANHSFEKGFYSVDYLANTLLDSVWINSIGRMQEQHATIKYSLY